MSHQSDLIAADIDQYLQQHRTKELLRLLTCGSVDDGKSTLIGRLLHDSKLIYEDQLAAITKASEKHGTQGETVDLALLVDGLKAEREQGITIDVAYRYFSTERRKFIIADCPGHEQYTRNMATGASTCELAIILVDARKGMLTQTRRHSFIVSLLGIRHVVVAVNKMDLVDYDEKAFEDIIASYRDFASRLDIPDIRFIPISALAGDNVVTKSERMPWYEGGTLMHLLETVHVASDQNLVDLRFPVQSVVRPSHEFRGYAGTLASGVVRKGDEIVVMPSQKKSKVASIVTFEGEIEQAWAPMSVCLTLEDEIDISRGDMLAPPANVPRSSEVFEAMLVWMSETPMVPGRDYLLKHTTRTVAAKVESLRYGVDVNTLRRSLQPALELNQIGRCQVRTQEPLVFDPYRNNRETGAFILIDRMTNATMAAGMIVDRQQATSNAWDVAPPATLKTSVSEVTASEREARFGQKGAVILLTGLSGSGKSSLARALERRLFDAGRTAVVLDGQDMRSGLSRDLGFSSVDRSENVRRFTEMARLLADAGYIVIGAMLAPERAVRKRAQEAIGHERFCLVHLDCPVEVCRQRDPSGNFQLVAQGGLDDEPGVTQFYELPDEPDLRIETAESSIEVSVEALAELLLTKKIVPSAL